ncbi:MAG: NAD-dependent epimerase/dehydratase family protein, partial [Pedobacter sp.]
IDIERDWGWAPDYVEAMWLMLQQDKPDDFVISTGKTNSLKRFIDYTFETLGLDSTKYVVSNPELMRPTDLKIGRSDPSKALNVLGWKATHTMEDVIGFMIESELEQRQ